MSQRELAEATGLTQVTISHIETGRTMPRLATQKLIAWQLGFEERDIWPPAGKRTRNEALREALASERDR